MFSSALCADRGSARSSPRRHPVFMLGEFRFHPHPSGMCLKSEGLSHGLKTCHRHVFLTAFRVLHLTQPKKYLQLPNGIWRYLVREMGLEPTRRSHTHLKRACLPFQHSRKCLCIITVLPIFVNTFLRKPLSFSQVFDKL